MRQLTCNNRINKVKVYVTLVYEDELCVSFISDLVLIF